MNDVVKETSKLVTVGLKLPNGLVLRLYKPVNGTEPVLGGGSRKVTRHESIPGQQVVLKGTAVHLGQAPTVLVVGGYAINVNVPGDFIREWVRQNKDHPVVVNNLLIIHESRSYVMDKANEQASVKSGLEPILPDTDTRISRNIKTAEEARAKVAAAQAAQEALLADQAAAA